MVHTRLMANWTPLRDLLASVDDRVTVSWPEIEHLVGGLPRSAYVHAAFWKGDRSQWPGFTTLDVDIGHSVTFVRRSKDSAPARQQEAKPAARRQPGGAGPPGIVLVGCVKQKLDYPAPARDLYTSTLFRKERAYAEATGAAWFVLSAEHGLVAPSAVLQPYDLRLSHTSREYRRSWGRRVVEQLNETAGPLAGTMIEIHAGAAYLDPHSAPPAGRRREGAGAPERDEHG